MNNTVRTTIRLRKDLLDQSRLISSQRDTSLQEVINETLARGFGEISDLNRHQKAMAAIDAFRESMRGKKVNPAPRAYARGIRGSLRGNNPFIPDLTVRAFWVRGKPSKTY